MKPLFSTTEAFASWNCSPFCSSSGLESPRKFLAAFGKTSFRFKQLLNRLNFSFKIESLKMNQEGMKYKNPKKFHSCQRRKKIKMMDK